MAEEKDTILHSIAKAEVRLKEIDAERDTLVKDLTKWKNDLREAQSPAIMQSVPLSSSIYPLDSRIAFFRSLFRGREDICPKLWISKIENRETSEVSAERWAERLGKACGRNPDRQRSSLLQMLCSLPG